MNLPRGIRIIVGTVKSLEEEEEGWEVGEEVVMLKRSARRGGELFPSKNVPAGALEDSILAGRQLHSNECGALIGPVLWAALGREDLGRKLRLPRDQTHTPQRSSSSLRPGHAQSAFESLPIFT